MSGSSAQHGANMLTLRESMAPAPNGQGVRAPDWENVPFEVGCARCGHDLRGRTEAKCPACGLEFDWAAAVPIEQLKCRHCDYHLYGLRETRCPECGESFTWEEALARYHRKRIVLFEYQWRERPIRSLIGTWFRAMVPGKLWKRVSIHDPPQVGPLWVMVVISLLVSLTLCPIFAGIDDWSWRRQFPGTTAHGWRTASITYLPWTVVRQVGSTKSYAPMGAAVIWCATSLGSLMIFRQSMTRCQVLPVHVLRVWTYTVVLFLPAWLMGMGRQLAALLQFYSGRVWSGVPPIHPLLLVASFAFSVWLIREGYKHYLRMDHSLGVAFASQVIAWLAVPALADGLPRILGLR